MFSQTYCILFILVYNKGKYLNFLFNKFFHPKPNKK